MTIPTVVLEAVAEVTTEIRCWRCAKMLAHVNITAGRVILVCPRCKAKNTITAGG